MSPGRAPFIVLEGPEGAGKSSLMRRLASALDERGRPYLATREPGGTPVAEAIREVLLDRPELEMDGVTELLLFSAARHAHVEDVILPALAAGTLVLCDRFELTTRVYQGLARGVPEASIRAVTSEATGGLLPDLYLVLDVPASLGRDRQHGPDFFPDRIEREETAFMERVRQGYRDLVAEGGDTYVLVDAAAPPGVVERRARDVLHDRFPEWFPAPK